MPKLTTRPTLLAALALAVPHLVSCSSDEPSTRDAYEQQISSRLESATCGSIQNIHGHDGILLAGQPSEADLAVAESMGVRTIITLRKEGEVRDYDEAAAVEALGMEFIALPFNGTEELTDEVFDRSRELLSNAERPMMMHCGSANRVGAVWLPWRVLDEGWDLPVALEEAKTVGLRSPGYEARALEYIASKR